MTDLIQILVSSAFVGIPLGLMIWVSIRNERQEF